MASGDLPRPLRAGDARIKVQNMRRRDFNPVGNNAPADLPLQPQVAKALTFYEPDLRPALKREGFLTRDSRVVERKKYGKKKARRSFQFSKR